SWSSARSNGLTGTGGRFRRMADLPLFFFAHNPGLHRPIDSDILRTSGKFGSTADAGSRRYASDPPSLVCSFFPFFEVVDDEHLRGQPVVRGDRGRHPPGL